MEQCDIDVDMAYLEINELNPPNGSVKRERELEQSSSSFISPVSDEDNPRRSLRKKFRISAPTNNARVLSKPKKFVEGSMKETMKYYLDKRVKRLHPSLETIFEEPQKESMMSLRKFKRIIEFPATVGLHKDKVKTKRRTMKAKKIKTIKRLKKKVSMDLLMKKLSTIEETDSNISNDSGSSI